MHTNNLLMASLAQRHDTRIPGTAHTEDVRPNTTASKVATSTSSLLPHHVFSFRYHPTPPSSSHDPNPTNVQPGNNWPPTGQFTRRPSLPGPLTLAQACERAGRALAVMWPWFTNMPFAPWGLRSPISGRIRVWTSHSRFQIPGDDRRWGLAGQGIRAIVVAMGWGGRDSRCSKP